MSKLTFRQRLLVIGLFSNADDHGKGKAKPAFIRSTIFPYDDISTNEIIDDMETVRATISIDFYEVEGNSYYRFTNWIKWQTVQKPQPSIIPDLVENHSGMNQESLSPKGKEEKRKEGGKEEKGREAHTPEIDDIEYKKESIRQLCIKMNIQGFTTYHLDIVYSYLGVADIEVIEAAIKKSENKPNTYLTNTLHGMINNDKITKADQLPGAKETDSNGGTKEGVRQGGNAFDDKPITGGKSGVLPSKWFNPEAGDAQVS